MLDLIGFNVEFRVISENKLYGTAVYLCGAILSSQR